MNLTNIIRTIYPDLDPPDSIAEIRNLKDEAHDCLGGFARILTLHKTKLQEKANKAESRRIENEYRPFIEAVESLQAKVEEFLSGEEEQELERLAAAQEQRRRGDPNW